MLVRALCFCVCQEYCILSSIVVMILFCYDVMLSYECRWHVMCIVWFRYLFEPVLVIVLCVRVRFDNFHVVPFKITAMPFVQSCNVWPVRIVHVVVLSIWCCNFVVSVHVCVVAGRDVYTGYMYKIRSDRASTNQTWKYDTLCQDWRQILDRTWLYCWAATLFEA